MARRDRNQAKKEARRIETAGGMIADLIAGSEWIRDNTSLKDDHSQSKYQEFQLIRVFGTDSSAGKRWREPFYCAATLHPLNRWIPDMREAIETGDMARDRTIPQVLDDYFATDIWPDA